MKTMKNTSPDVVAYVEMNGGRLLDIEWEGSLAVFVFEVPDGVLPKDFYTSPFEEFKRARNRVMDRLNQAKSDKKFDDLNNLMNRGE